MAARIRNRLWIAGGVLIAAAAVSVGSWILLGPKRGGPAGRPVAAPESRSKVDGMSNSALGIQRWPGDTTITLSPDKLRNAHLTFEEAVVRTSDGGGVRTTGTVQSNAYKEVPVPAIAGGIVREVNVVVGDQVRRGQKIATIFSTELADAQTSYLGLQAEIAKHHEHYHRAEQLVEIGAVSREDFEVAQAEYKTEQAKLAAARQRLMFLGMSASQIDGLHNASQMSALVSIEAPITGTVLSRSVNAGEVVMIGKELLKAGDLTTVWVIAQIHEGDSASVKEGTRAEIVVPALPSRRFFGRVSYIDPRVDTQARTVQVRVELNNPGRTLKLGMFVDVYLGGREAAAMKQFVSVPRTAVQVIGGRQVVFIVTAQPGVLLQREVSAGAEEGGSVPIHAGLSGGESVVTEGSFLLRAESVRLNPEQLKEKQSPRVSN
jgi:membrane fusion protein, heavy metal efflux system